MASSIESNLVVNKSTPEPNQHTPQDIEITVYDAPPNRGFRAWTQVMGSFFLFFNSWGVVNTFGVFQTYYEINLLSVQSSSNILWIGAIQAFLLLLVGVVTGPLYDASYFRALIITGSGLVVVGFMTLSLCTKYWQIILAQALCIGLGNECLYIPFVAILPQYFSSRKAIATGIAASGSSFGGVLYPILFRQLQPRIGFAWATRVLGFIVLATSLLSIGVMRARRMPPTKRVSLELSAFKEPPYALFCIAMLLGYIGIFCPIFYIQSYAVGTETMGEDLAFYLVAILNAASIPGRIVPGLLGPRIGPLNILLTSAAISGTLIMCWIGIQSSSGLVALAVLYGFISGAFVSLPAVALTGLTEDLRTLGTRMGMCSVLCGFGSLCGAPVAGAILNASDSYLGVQLYARVATYATAVLLLLSHVSKVGVKFMAKA
ncbi:monocarboxylate permease-like protein [Aspergillus affinis]|uniref:monocarboxylate permease-like protein n=1 Tax=Aspergillus affinis TaxID=1070780 RepID=UPI0022FF3F51|nr:monocarboxylate permease-like protein [Aspergillus affinis]KAI9042124.1 monocarboxylate permease-like protein [Aspergillus affinis]